MKITKFQRHLKACACALVLTCILTWRA